MVKVKKVTKHYFITDNDEKIYFNEPLDEIPTVEEMQALIDKKEKEVRRLLDIGEDNNS